MNKRQEMLDTSLRDATTVYWGTSSPEIEKLSNAVIELARAMGAIDGS